MIINTLDQLIIQARCSNPRNIAIAVADDTQTLQALQQATQQGLIKPILFGNIPHIKEITNTLHFDISFIETVEVPDHQMACKAAVSYVKSGKAEILMKGMVSTATLMRAVVDKENGICTNNILSHFSINELPGYPKLLSIADAAMNIAPDIDTKIAIVNNAVKVLRKLGYTNPYVAIIAPVEVVNPKIESTVHAALLSAMNKRNQIEHCTIDGPLALDTAISKDAALHKGLKGEVAGNADLLIAHNIDTANVLYKAINFLAGGTSAAVIAGASVPIVLTSRADSEKSKLYSIALACCL